jgi:uncharacterized cupredoxin-like copper-binding protein
MKKIRVVFLFRLFVIAAFGLSSCGGASRTIELTLSDFHFEPDTFTIPAGEEITVKIDNEGFVSHQFVIFKLGTNPEGKVGPEDQENIYWRFEVLPGHSDSATFIAPSEPGEYFFTCGIFGHLEAGMSGSLTVVGTDTYR